MWVMLTDAIYSTIHWHLQGFWLPVDGDMYRRLPVIVARYRLEPIGVLPKLPYTAEVALYASAAFLACSSLYERKTMIRENDWKQLEMANRELVMRLERLRKVRASGNRDEIQRAEMAYFQALQWVYDAAVGAVASGAVSASD